MYKKFHGFQEMPFPLMGDSAPDTVYLSRNYKEILPLLINSVEKNVMLSIVLGEDGVGKTTFIKYMCNFFPQVFAANLISTQLESTQEFLQQVLTSFGHKISNKDNYDMLLQLSFLLSTKFREQDGQSTLLIIDNADSMSLDALKGIELLLGLNAEGSQILQLILVGQPKLSSMLNVPSLHNLMQNALTQFSLEPLTKEETLAYINHKLELAGVQNENLFDKQACSAIYEYSGGVPSIIHWLCDKSLLRSSELEKQEINTELILGIIKDHVGNSEKKNILSSSSLLFFTSFVGIILAFLLVYKFLLPSEVLQEKSPIELKIESSSLEPSIPKPIEKIKIVKKKEVPIKKVILDKASTIETQLSIAEQQIAELKFSTPKEDNAFETYKAILENSPNEKRALKGLQNISNYYLKQAKNQHVKNRVDKAQLSISKGLKVSPNHKELNKLKELIEANKQRVENKQNKIKTLFEKAKQEIKALQYTKPLNDNAYNTYQKIISLDNDNSQAKYGVLRVLSRLTTQAQNAFAEKDYTAAFNRSEEILALPSKEVSGPFHKKVIFTAVETKKNIIKNLLTLAYNQQKTQQLTNRSGDKAFRLYNKVLKFSPNNKDAKKGLNSLRIQYQKLARVALSAKKIDQTLKLTKEGLSIFPNNSLLLALQSNAVLKKNTLKNNKDKQQKLKSFGTF